MDKWRAAAASGKLKYSARPRSMRPRHPAPAGLSTTAPSMHLSQCMPALYPNRVSALKDQLSHLSPGEGILLSGDRAQLQVRMNETKKEVCDDKAPHPAVVSRAGDRCAAGRAAASGSVCRAAVFANLPALSRRNQ